MDAINIKNLTKRYGKFRGIDSIDLTVKKGEFFGFIGPNGAGKSTTIRTLLGLIAPTSGDAAIFGMDIKTQKKEILSRIGYLPSEAVFYPSMKVKEVLKMSADLHKKYGSDKNTNSGRAERLSDISSETKRLCERLQLDTNRKISDLSFGNRKKVAIVCALQHNPELIILDEPTSGLDPLMQKEFFSILKEKNQAGATIFMSSHVLSEIQHNCTRAAIIREGKIIACDTVEALSKTSAKRVQVRGKVDISSLNNVKYVQNDYTTLSFLYNGDMRDLLAVLSASDIQDLTITEPDLEEIFLHYYEDNEISEEGEPCRDNKKYADNEPSIDNPNRPEASPADENEGGANS